MSNRRFTIGAWYRTADGRNYAFPPVTLHDHGEAMRLYRSMRDDPRRFGVPTDVLLYVVGPVTEEEKFRSGDDDRTWRYAGTPAASTIVIDRYEEWRDDTPAPAPEPQQPALTEETT